jgi:hypothetical protein
LSREYKNWILVLGIVRQRVPYVRTHRKLRGLDHVDAFPAFSVSAKGFKFYDSSDFRKQCVVRASSNINTGVNVCAALPHDDRAGAHHLA